LWRASISSEVIYLCLFSHKTDKNSIVYVAKN
jgi:hypothetical protein